MKKYITPLLCAAALCSCTAQNKASSQSSVQNVTEFSSYSFAENINETAASSPDKSLSFTVTEKGVDVSRAGEILQTIEGEFLEELSFYDDVAPEEFLTVRDYDFDGYEDLFIPTLIGRPNTPGIYYRYNAETGLFDEWEKLNEIGCLMNVNDDDTLTNNIGSSAVDHESITYKWENDVLKPISRETQYIGNDGEVYIDSFDYDNIGNETLVKRERAILDEDHNWLGTEEVRIQSDYSFSVNEKGVDVIHDGKPIQTLECTPMNENMLISDDYNFDGYNDLFAITDIQDVKLSGIYYKFNPETSMFEEWEELNRFGYSFDTGISSNVSIGKVLSYDTDDHERFIYKWEDDDLVLVEKSITIIDKHNNKATTELYYIDADGNETLIDSAERDLDENPLDFD